MCVCEGDFPTYQCPSDSVDFLPQPSSSPLPTPTATCQQNLLALPSKYTQNPPPLTCSGQSHAQLPPGLLQWLPAGLLLPGSQRGSSATLPASPPPPPPRLFAPAFPPPRAPCCLLNEAFHDHLLNTPSASWPLPHSVLSCFSIAFSSSHILYTVCSAHLP